MKLNIGTTIRDRRRAMDMTQEQLAERLGVTCQSVSRWENGATYPDIEFLPLLADLFGITLDELMGHTKTAKEQRLAKLWEEYEAMEDLEASIDHLARMKEEYPTEWSIVHELLNNIARRDVHNDELYSLTMEVLENCPDERIRWDATKTFLYTAEEEAITPDFLDRYTQHVDRNILLEKRYLDRGDWERYEELRQCNLLRQLHTIFDERLRRSRHASAADSAWAQQTGLGIINLFTGYHSSGLSNIVDTTPDLWYGEKYWLGLRLSCALASSEQVEAALDVLESTVTLTENVFSQPVGTRLTYRTRTLDRMDRTVVSYYKSRWFDCMKLDSQRDPNHVPIGAWWIPTEDGGEEAVWYVEFHPLTERAGWEWFDPIRNHPRYLACIQRMEAIRARLASDEHA